MYQTTELIKKYELSGSRYGLDREIALLNALGNPDEKLKIIHVAGTNGKGSTCEYLTNILISAGKSVGTFTSPAVYSFNETFKINGSPASDEILEKYLDIAYRASLRLAEKPTAFEIETAAAFKMFEGEGCEYAVIECGMGGLNDSTNAMTKKEIAVITSVSLEHTAYLGGTILEICEQKGGIVKDCPLVCSCLLPQEATNYFATRGGIFAGQGLEITAHSLHGQRFVYGGESYEISMLGKEQAYNAAVAIECAKILGLPQEAVKRGLSSTRLDGRVEIIKTQKKTYILDGCHNPESCRPLREILGEIEGSKTLVFGCLSDKDVDGDLAQFGNLADEVIAVSSSSYRAMDLEKIISACRRYFKRVKSAPDVGSALNGADADTVVVCGSFTILKEAKQWIEKKQ